MHISDLKPNSDLRRFLIKDAERYYLRESYRIQRDGVAGSPAWSVDEDGRLCIKAAVGHEKYPGKRLLIELRLAGGNSLQRFAHVFSTEKGGEGVYVDDNQRFFGTSNQDPPFALADSIHSDDWPNLMAAMLLAPRLQDIELFGDAHPASATVPFLLDMHPHGDFTDLSDVPGGRAHLDHIGASVQSRFEARFAWKERLLSVARKEPSYTVLAPSDRSMPVWIALDIDECPSGTPFATFSADRRNEAIAFAQLLETLGYGEAINEGHSYTWINLDKGQTPTVRNHAWEIEGMTIMLRKSLHGQGDPLVDEAISKLRYVTRYFDLKYLRPVPYRRWQEREAWLSVWPEVSAVIGEVTPDRLASAKNEHHRLGLCLKVALDWLTEATIRLPEHA